MKNGLPLISIICLCCIYSACSKSSGTDNVKTFSSFYFTANDTLVVFPVNIASIQDVLSTHTTLITGQYQDTSTKRGSISFRCLGDTTGRYTGDSLLVTYVSPSGDTYYNTKDSSNYVTIDQYVKKYNGTVSGRFSMKVANGASTIQFTKGAFTAIYQE